MTDMKTCTKCGDEKSTDEYYRCGRASDGLRSQCKACMKAYFDANAARKSEYDRIHRKANHARITEREAAYYGQNRETVLARMKDWRDSNSEAISERRRSRPHVRWSSLYRWRARKHGFPIVVEDFTKDDVIDRYGDGCFYCGGEFQELDHYVAVSKGGPHTLENVRPSCVKCNRSKHDGPPTQPRHAKETR